MNDAVRRKIRVHNRDLRVLAADSWHQPDSAENLLKKKPNPSKMKAEAAEVMASAADSSESATAVSEEDSVIHKVNDDCLIHIFSFLPIVDRVRIERGKLHLRKYTKNITLIDL